MFTLFSYFLLLYLVSIIATFTVGHFFFKLSKLSFENIIRNIFAKCVMGTVLVVSFYAVLINGYKTIFIAAFPLLALLIYIARKDILFESKKSPEQELDNINYKKILLGTGLASMAVFLINFLILNDFSLPLWISNSHEDYIYYAKISKFLSLTGQENGFHIYNEMLPSKYHGIAPYHYFDLWFNNLLLNFHSFSTFLSYKLVAIPFLLFLKFLGIVSILSSYFKSIWIKLTVSILIIYWFGSSTFWFQEYLPQTSALRDINLLSYTSPKLYPVSILLILFFNSIVSNLKPLAFFSMFFLIFAYSSTLPAIVGGVIFFVIYLIYKRNLPDSYLILKFFVITFAGLLIVFSINPTPSLTTDNPYSVSSVLENFRFEELGKMLRIFIGYHYLTFLLYMIPIIVFLFSWKKITENENIKYLLLLLSCIYLASIVSVGFFWREINSSQLYQNIALPIAELLSIIFIFSIKNTSKNVLGWGGFTLILLNNFVGIAPEYLKKNHSFDVVYYSNIKELIDKDAFTNKIGVSLYGINDYSSVWTFAQTSNLSDIIFAYDDRFQAISLGDYEMKIDTFDELSKLRANNIIKKGFYKNYLENRIIAEDYPYKNLPHNAFEHQVQYIIDNKVEYAIVSKNYPYWERLKQISKDYFENNNTGERFIVFDNSKK